MSYQIEITPAARREIRALPAYVRSQAVQLIDELGRDPKPARAKELRDKGFYFLTLYSNHELIHRKKLIVE